MDFDFPEEMLKLHYNQVFIDAETGEELAVAPSIAGFYGVYTALAKNFSLSYNVRFSSDKTLPRRDSIWLNVKNEIADGYVPMQNLLMDISVSKDLSYDDAVEIIMSQKVNAPCFVVLANREDQAASSKWGQGVVIAKAREEADFVDCLKV